MNKLEVLFNSLPDKEKRFIYSDGEFHLDYNPSTDVQIGHEDYCVAQLTQGLKGEDGKIEYSLTIITHPDHRREKCATIVMGHVKNWIRIHNGKLVSKAMKTNEASIAWHDAMGGKQVGEIWEHYIYHF